MTLKSGFRIALLGWGAIIAGLVSALVYSQSIFYEETLRSETLDHVATEGTQLVQLTQEVILYGEARSVTQWSQQFSEVEESINRAVSDLPADLRGSVDALSIRFGQLRPLHDRLLDARASAADPSVIAVLASQLFQDAITLQSSLRELKGRADRALQSAYDRSRQRRFTIFGGFTAVASLFGVAVLALFRSRVLTPLGDMLQVIESLRQGQRARVKSDSDDEIGAVAIAFNTLLDEQDLARARLEDLALRFQNVFNQAAVGMALVAPSGEWIEVNQCLCDILGYAREELAALGYRHLTPEEDIEDNERHVRAMLAGDRDRDAWESVRRRKDGRIIDVRITAAIARDPVGRPLFFVTATEDISERKEAERTIRGINRQLEEQTRALQRSNADLENYAWVASHDLREPLRTVSTYVGLIERRLGADIRPDLKEFIDYAIDGAKRMDALIQDLLEYARVGHDDEPEGEVALDAVLALCQRDLSVAFAEAGAELVVVSPLPVVIGRRRELDSVIRNLIANALKYRHPDRPPHITVSATRDGNSQWIIGITDNGMGIEPQYRERVFGLFQRLQPRASTESTGIGLAVCKKIVDRWGGRIWIEDGEEGGVTFKFTLPDRISDGVSP